MAGTPTKQYASVETGVCRRCNSNIIPKNHPLKLFGPKAMEEKIAVFLGKVSGVKFSFDDGLPSHICRVCYGKMKKFQEFIKVVLHSKTQQESIVRWKRGKRVDESPISSTSPATRRERKKTRSSETDNRQVRVTLSLHCTLQPAVLQRHLQCAEFCLNLRSRWPNLQKQLLKRKGSYQLGLVQIVPDPQKENSKSVEILANSGRRNPVLVKVKLILSFNWFKSYTLIQASCLSLGSLYI